MKSLSRGGRRVGDLVVALCLMGLFTACSPKAPGGGAHPSVVLKVASQKGGVKALMLASHALDGAPYTVEWSEFPAAQPLLEALSGGAVDLGAVGDAPFLFAYANDPKLRVVQVYRSGAGGHAVAVVVPAHSPIRTPADLKGRRIATGKGSIGHYLLLRLLEQANLKASDVQVVFLSPGDAKAALGGGSVDAWSTWGAYIGLETLHGGGRVLADGTGLLNSYGFQASSAPSISAKAPQIADFLHRLTVAQHWEQNHIGDYAKVLARETGLPEDVAIETVKFQHPETVPITSQVIAEERDTLGHFVTAGVIPAAPRTDGAFDPRFNASAKP
jgi:sulfonate transport system substrate-binding protein